MRSRTVSGGGGCWQHDSRLRNCSITQRNNTNARENITSARERISQGHVQTGGGLLFRGSPCIIVFYLHYLGAGLLSQYSVWLRTGRPGDRGSIPGGGKMIFFSNLLCPDRFWGPPNLSNGYWGYLTEDKARPGRDADHTPNQCRGREWVGVMPPHPAAPP
jgi:hypothetical protein